MKYRKPLTLSVVIAGVTLGIAAVQAAAPVIVPPSVPSNLEVPAGSTVYLVGHARGTQNYVCLPKEDKFAWTLFGPQATLFDDNGNQQITHFLSANPGENGTPRATWQHSDRTSSVWAMKVAESDDARYVEPGAIKWFLLQVKGTEEGSRPHDRLTKTTVVQRVNTSGGVAPASECASAGDVGKTKFVPYSADYVFYR